jgi:hypothetical protein
MGDVLVQGTIDHSIVSLTGVEAADVCNGLAAALPPLV